MKDVTPRIILTGGGTAGHVLPNLALIDGADRPLARALGDGRITVEYIGTAGGMERRLLASNAPNIAFHQIPAARLRRYFTLRNLATPFVTMAGVLQAMSILRKNRTGAVFSKGGFVAAPVVWAAAALSIPVVIHESDFSPALTTRLTAPFARKIFCAFPETAALLPARYAEKTEAVGLPLRASLFRASREEAIEHFRLDRKRRTILVFGGSLGARVLNDIMRSAAPALDRFYNVIHVTGEGKGSPIEGLQFYRPYEYLGRDMALALAAADLAVCRAGASSIFELAAMRIPMILVPLDLDQSRGDQIDNARSFTEKGWAVTLRENELSVQRLLDETDRAMMELEQRKEALTGAPAPGRAAREIGETLLSLALG